MSRPSIDTKAFIEGCNKDPDTLIDGFFGDYRFLSNFHACPVWYEGDLYPTSENAYQAAKVEHLEDRRKFYYCPPKYARLAGRRVALRGDWEAIKVEVMRTVLVSKFSNPDLKQMLLDTGEVMLVEGNWWGDRFWGVCNGSGENTLGKLLMQLRDTLRKTPKEV